MRHESCCARLYIMQVRPGCAFVLEWNLPFRNPGSATDVNYNVSILLHAVCAFVKVCELHMNGPEQANSSQVRIG